MAGILIVGAHAMDAEVMAGGIAARAARAGQPVILLHLTRGERGHPQKSREAFGKQLEGEMQLAAETLQVIQTWAQLLAPLPPPAVVAPTITQVINHYEIDLIITHWKGSWHRSHVRAYEAVNLAVKTAQGSVSLAYAENCEDLTGFNPDRFVSIEDVYAIWQDALQAYELFRLSLPGSTSPGSIPYWAYYTASARIRGLQAGFEYAQALMIGSGELPAYLQASPAIFVNSA